MRSHQRDISREADGESNTCGHFKAVAQSAHAGGFLPASLKRGNGLLRTATDEPLISRSRPFVSTNDGVRPRRRGFRWTIHLGLILVCGGFLLPFVWIVSTSLKSLPQTREPTPRLLPQPWEPGNYLRVFHDPQVRLRPLHAQYTDHRRAVGAGHDALQLAGGVRIRPHPLSRPEPSLRADAQHDDGAVSGDDDLAVPDFPLDRQPYRGPLRTGQSFSDAGNVQAALAAGVVRIGLQYFPASPVLHDAAQGTV